MKYIIQRMIEFPIYWKIWIYENNKNKNWDVSNFKTFFEIKNSDDFWEFDAFVRENPLFLKNNIFVMKDGIFPTWEVKENRDGGCWSFKCNTTYSLKYFMHFLLFIITDTFMENTNISKEHVNGLCLSIKKQNACIIQVWNNDYFRCQSEDHNLYVKENFGIDIIYKKLKT